MMYEAYAPTALRSGRVLNKNVESKSNDNGTIQSNRPTSSSDAKGRDGQQNSPPGRTPLLANGSTTSIGTSFAEPIELDSSSNERSEARSKPSVYTSNSHNQALAREVDIKRDSKIERFETSYAHPINFKLLSDKDGSSECHFCKDWTMAVIGHGTRRATARRLRSPPEYHETANGHRDEGKEAARMCVRCSLNRLLMMRCHSPHYQPNNPPPSTLSHPFTKVHAKDLTEQQPWKYLQHLFCRMNGETHLISPAFELPACSLCPQPAVWKCCKFQERDQAMRPCQIPEADSSMLARANSAVVDLSSSSSSPINDRPPQTRLQAAEPVVISLLDSSDDEEVPVSRSTPAPPRQPTRPLIKLEGVLSTTTTSRPQVPNPALRPPLRGCGLHLCTPCHIFVTQSCKGLLPESRILAYIKANPLGKRADVQWLFKGSLLEESFEHGRKT